jgi:hypothetical protein
MKTLPMTEEVDRLGNANSNYKPGVYQTNGGFVIRNKTSQIYLTKSEAINMFADLDSLVCEIVVLLSEK